MKEENKSEEKIKNLELEKKRDIHSEASLPQAFELLKSDFEQRSQQALNLTLDRSKFIRLSILVWSTPLLIGVAFIEKKSIESLFESAVTIGLISLCFYFCALVNFVIFALNIHNSNAIRISTSGINYIRSLYFNLLHKNSIVNIEEDEILSNIVHVKNGKPKFSIVYSKSNNILLYSYAVVNSIYILFGLTLLVQINNFNIIAGGVIIGVLLILGHFLVIGTTSKFKKV